MVGQIVLRAVGRWVDELACSTLENMFKRRLFACLLRNDYSEVSSVHSGEWMNRLTNDAVVTANGLVRIICANAISEVLDTLIEQAVVRLKERIAEAEKA